MNAALPLIVTRADPGGLATVERARERGLDARHMPLFASRALVWDAPDSQHFDALLLTSAQAVRLAGPHLATFADLPVYAVGAATADAAFAAGLRVAMVGDADGQSLLDAMAPQEKKQILWLSARDRSTFDTRGSALVAIPVYAVDPVDPPPGWAALIAAPAVVMAHSSRGAARIAELVGARRNHLTLLAISPRAAAAAGGGWGAVMTAARPDDGAMLAEACALCHKGG